MVWWDNKEKSLTLLELTIPFGTLMEEAANHKRDKYADLVANCELPGYKSTLITIEVASRGLPGFTKLGKSLKVSPKSCN